MHLRCFHLSIFCTKCDEICKLLTCIVNLPLHSSLRRHGRARLATSKLAPLCLESSVPFSQRSTSRLRLWPRSFSSSSRTSSRCQGNSSCSSRRRGDSSSSGSTTAERWRRPAKGDSGALPGRLCCTLPGCVCPSPGAKVGWIYPQFCRRSHPWLLGLLIESVWQLERLN